MRVRVRLLGSLRPVSTPRETDFEVAKGSDVSTLIEDIMEKYPQTTETLKVATRGNLILLGGIEIGNLSGLSTELGEGAEVVFIPVTHGG